MKKLLISTVLLAACSTNTSPAPCNCGGPTPPTAHAGTYIPATGSVGTYSVALGASSSSSVHRDIAVTLDRIDSTLEDKLLPAAGLNVKTMTCEPPPNVCR